MYKQRLLHGVDCKGQIRTTNQNTGEVETKNKGKLIWVNDYPRRNGEWFEVTQKFWDQVLREHWTLTDLRVLLACLRFMEQDNLLTVKQSKIAELLGIATPNVSHAVKRLIARGFLIRVQKEGYKDKLAVSSFVGWRGAAENGHKARQAEVRKKIDDSVDSFYRTSLKKSACEIESKKITSDIVEGS